MKPLAFDYLAPQTMPEALSLLAEYQDDAKVLAGGQSLVPMLNMRLVKPNKIVDINGIPGLDYIRSDGLDVVIGGLARQRSIETSALLKKECAILPRAVQDIADVQIRNRGTIGGSLAHSDPAAELCAVTYTLGGTITATSKAGERRISAEDFFLGPLMTALATGELVTEVRLPKIAGRSWSFRSVSPRHGDLAIAGVMVILDLDKGGKCREGRIGLFGVGPAPMRALQAESLLQGKSVDARLAALAAEQAVTECDPDSDVRATREYRLKLVKNLVQWTLLNAVGGR